MPDNFRYRARRNGGSMVEGVIEAASADAAAAALRASGATPVDIVAAGDSRRRGLGEAFEPRAPTLTDLALFARQIYTMLRAGIPVHAAIAGLSRSTRNPELARALREIGADLESGRELSAALARHSMIFSTLFVNMVRVGENTGHLDDALLKVSHYLELERDTRQRVKSALRYPMFVVIAIVIAIAVINVLVVPAFAKVFERAQVDLPLPTRIILATSELFVQWWPVMLTAFVAGVWLTIRYVRTPAGRYGWDRMKLRIPIFGDIVYRATLGRFARAFAMALGAGVPLLQALVVVARAVDNEFVGEKILGMRTAIERGESLTRAALASAMFSPLVLQMLGVGEETGAVDELLGEVAGFYEREVEYDIRNLSQTIEPVLIAIIGVMVLVLALGVFLPMWDLATVKLGR
jgi:MSHA biogenesis protein MshG